ncbi:MAG: calcineurin-like phosphoesterase C-terminal domain-containing protein [Candidatus Pseudobacter hemicellulosilyticus]|uniref:Calcineurin-like phosphoesterase C-terminal domain-containing protein n=1 Tax=Candidatus Pseudobacter hemicellulosilyticus TaxID=3121375 RepID=A0AAJ5WQV5_9BACT|nr:MAG: calcineurin-like phosphoesterase C-terminal domain-containing protein [Pseudobacter sp.]
MKWMAFILAALPVMGTAQMVKGFVYQDQNGNGKKDKKEKGIEGVCVSNGQQIVQTDARGGYSLPLGNDNTIFVIKPAGYRLPQDARHFPLFYYTHKPQGSPAGLRYAGTAPTGPLPASVDLALIPYAEPDTFTAVVMGDPQTINETEMDYFSRGIMDELKGNHGAQFGITLGDLLGDRLHLYDAYKQAISKARIPWFNVMGNHDMNLDVKTDSLSDETYEAHFGPVNFAFNFGKAHFLLLDDILYPNPQTGKGYIGGFREDQWTFIENDLRLVRKDQLIVLAFHIPLDLHGGEWFREQDRVRLFGLLKDFPQVLVLSAHSHLQQQFLYTGKDGWERAQPLHEYNVAAACGDFYYGEPDAKGIPAATMRDGTPKGYALLKCSGNQYAIDYKAAGYPADYRMSINIPKVIPFQQRTSAMIFTNFFMGHKNDLVELSFDEGEWKKMVHVSQADPDYLALQYRWDVSDTLLAGRRPSMVVPSTHLWAAYFPENLSVGEHSLSVRVRDLFGQEFVREKRFRVEPPLKFGQAIE